MAKFVIFVFVLFFLFPFINCVPQDTTDCVYVRMVKIMDCSDQGFDRLPVPGAKHKTEKIIVMDLRRNNVSFVSEKDVLQQYPGLVVLDIRDNPIKCDELVFSRIRIISNCKICELSCRKTRSMDNGYTVNTIYPTQTASSVSLKFRASMKPSLLSVKNKQTASSVSLKFKASMKPSLLSVKNKQTTILLLSTIIPALAIILLSGIMLWFRMCTCRQRVDTQDTEMEMSQINPSLAVNTKHSTPSTSLSSIELYSVSSV